jgi:ubiquinone/menaquinone biosynthesis C-methylase UbiE
MRAEVIQRVKQIYDDNGNVMEYLRNLDGRDYNTVEDIMISYDFQAGSYNRYYLSNREEYDRIGFEASDVIAQYVNKIFQEGARGYRILEGGVGEGTTYAPVWTKLEKKPDCGYGFDISWSRIKECNRFLEMQGINNTYTFVGDMFSMPLKDNSIDIVYTYDSLEPNGGNERTLLKELYRVASKYVILFEPGYEFANEKQRERMNHHGYVKNLYKEARDLGFNVVEHHLMKYMANEMNPTAVLVIEKGAETIEENPLCDPISKGDLEKGVSSYFCPKTLVAYPVVENIPCLNTENATLATKYL